MISAPRLTPDAEARALRAVAEALNQAEDLQAALGRALDAVLPLVGSESGWIVLLEGLGGTRLAAARNLPPGLEAADKSGLQGPCQCLDRLRCGPLRAAAHVLECDQSGAPRHHASVPLRAGRAALGNLNLAAAPDRVFAEDELRLLAAVADQIGVAIDRARLYEAERRWADEVDALARSRQEALDRLESAQSELRRRLTELSALNAAAALLGRSRQTEEGLGRLLEAAMRITGMEAGQISLFDEASGRPGVQVHRGLSAEWRLAWAEGVADCLCGWVARQAEPLCLADAEGDPRATCPAGKREGLRAYWAVPLMVEGKPLGVLSLHSRTARPATPQERDLLAAIAGQVGVALTYLRLYQEVRRLAATDPLTGVHNRRALEERLHEEMRRARRYRRPLSVIMADVDHFKRYNDAHGHPAGDALLRRVAGLIRARLRETDFVARYGGDEFTILLPETDKAGGLEVAGQVRSAVGGLRVRLTVSLGVAAFPEDAPDAGALIARADRALYQAKRAGRDRVCSA